MGHRTGKGVRTVCEALNATLRNLDFVWGQWEAMRFSPERFREMTLPEAASGDTGAGGDRESTVWSLPQSSGCWSSPPLPNTPSLPTHLPVSALPGPLPSVFSRQVV